MLTINICCIGTQLCHVICSWDLDQVCICAYYLFSVINFFGYFIHIKFLMSLLKNNRPFRRLWWYEIVSTVVTRQKPQNQVIIPNCALFGTTNTTNSIVPLQNLFKTMLHLSNVIYLRVIMLAFVIKLIGQS